MPAVTWLTDSEWSALWSQIRPNLRSVEEFRDLVMAGRLDIYKRDEMDKVVRFLKQLLKGKGRLKDAEAGGKGVMTKSQLASHVAKLVEADAAAETQEEEAELLQQPRRRQPRRDEDATTPTEATVPPSPPQPARTRILSTAALSPALPPSHGATHVVKPLESPRGSKTHHHASFSLPVPAPLPPTAPLPRVLRFPPWHGPIPSKPQPVTAFEPHQSPLNPVDSCIARIPLRMGNVSRPIELTPANMAKLNDRTHRLVLFPVEGITFLPSAWPASKDVAITVNRQPYAATWKRNWPAKKMDMKRTYLLADITALVTKHKSTQTISLDCFARDYYANIVVALVGSVPENVVAGAIRDKPGYRAYVAHEALKKIYTDALIQPAGDRDVEIDASTVTVVDPISRGIIMIPVRGSRCEHLQCVDLQSFLRSCHIQCYWNCPICDRVMHVDEIVIDPYMSTALSNPAITSDTQLQVSLDSAVSVGFRWTIAIAPPSVLPASSLLQRKPPSSLPLTELSDSDGSESNVPHYVYYGGRKVLRESRRKNAGTSDAPIEID